jgi:hypothetical protein
MSTKEIKPGTQHLEDGAAVNLRHGDNALKLIGDERVEVSEEDVRAAALRHFELH